MPLNPNDWYNHPKLTNDDVRRIREMRFDGSTTTELAVVFGVSRSHIYAITTGRERRYQGGPIFGPHAQRPERPRSCDGPQPIAWKAS